VLLARGGFEVDLAWAKGHLTQARVRATQDGVFRIYSEGRLSKDITLKRGQSLTWPKNT
jgi:alpha-L-fucosidase 2